MRLKYCKVVLAAAYATILSPSQPGSPNLGLCRLAPSSTGPCRHSGLVWTYLKAKELMFPCHEDKEAKSFGGQISAVGYHHIDIAAVMGVVLGAAVLGVN